MGGHQIGRPKPGGQRQLGVVHDGAGGDRGLSAAAGALPGPWLGLQLPGFALATAGAPEARGPARRNKVSDAGSLIWEVLLELNQGAGEIGHFGLSAGLCSLYVLHRPTLRRYNILYPRTQRDK